MDFDKWFKRKCPDLHVAILCGDYVAKKYKKIAKLAYKIGQKSRQSEIDQLKKQVVYLEALLYGEEK